MPKLAQAPRPTTPPPNSGNLVLFFSEICTSEIKTKFCAYDRKSTDDDNDDCNDDYDSYDGNFDEYDESKQFFSADVFSYPPQSDMRRGQGASRNVQLADHTSRCLVDLTWPPFQRSLYEAPCLSGGTVDYRCMLGIRLGRI